MEKDLDLVILTSDTLFQHVKTSLDLFRLLTLQLNDGPAVEADPLIHVVDRALFTGGKPLFTHWVYAEFIVGFEPKYSAWAYQAHWDYFCNLLSKPPSTDPADMA